MEQQHIDDLLERYLGLLDEYTQLRQRLSQLQSGVYQNIARANFSGERGMRYGQDHYDERMQAIRLISIDQDEDQRPTFSISSASEEEDVKSEEKDKSSATQDINQGPESEAEEEKPAEKKRKKNKNPLHWFGLFAPMALRTAQTQSVQAIEDIIPQLVSINTEMLNVEIEVRRARKRRAKTEAAEKKTGPTTTDIQSKKYST